MGFARSRGRNLRLTALLRLFIHFHRLLDHHSAFLKAHSPLSPASSTLNMGGSSKTNASIQAYLTPSTSPIKGNGTTPDQQSHIGDGFTNEEIREALNPAPVDSWHPTVEYADCEISDLYAGPRAVTFMGRVANIFDCSNTPKTPRSAKGCLKLCVKDGGAAITVSIFGSDKLSAKY